MRQRLALINNCAAAARTVDAAYRAMTLALRDARALAGALFGAWRSRSMRITRRRRIFYRTVASAIGIDSTKYCAYALSATAHLIA